MTGWSPHSSGTVDRGPAATHRSGGFDPPPHGERRRPPPRPQGAIEPRPAQLTGHEQPHPPSPFHVRWCSPPSSLMNKKHGPLCEGTRQLGESAPGLYRVSAFRWAGCGATGPRASTPWSSTTTAPASSPVRGGGGGACSADPLAGMDSACNKGPGAPPSAYRCGGVCGGACVACMQVPETLSEGWISPRVERTGGKGWPSPHPAAGSLHVAIPPSDCSPAASGADDGHIRLFDVKQKYAVQQEQARGSEWARELQWRNMRHIIRTRDRFPDRTQPKSRVTARAHSHIKHVNAPVNRRLSCPSQRTF